MNESAKTNAIYFVKWSIYAIVTGLTIGLVGMLFRKGVDFGIANWKQHPQFILLSPLSALLIVALQKSLHEEKNGGTNTVIDSITEGKHITVQTTPLIFFSTVLSHLVGASVGREGAALMMGGSLGEALSKLFRMDEKDKRIAIMCGMSACFSAIFGTPLAAAVFPMEMISVGVMYYAALIPCLFASFIASHVSLHFGVAGEVFPITEVPDFHLPGAVTVILFSMLCALLAMGFSIILYRGHHYTAKRIPNPWLRALIGAFALIALTALNQRFFTGALDFNGGGFGLIEKAFRGEAAWYSFLFKILFTCVCIFGSFKGGEIVPTLTIGACFGAAFAQLFHLPVQLYAGIGIAAFFVGMTNSPFSSLLLCFELFGFEGMPYYAFAIAVSFTLSGYYGLYTSQKFPYSKTEALFINRKGPRKLWEHPGDAAEEN